MTTNALMELADRLEGFTKLSESGRNDDGVEGVAIPGVDCYDFDDLLRQAATEIKRLTELSDKYKWQVRDTCVRAERAEARLRTAAAEGGEAVAEVRWNDALATFYAVILPRADERLTVGGKLYLHPPTDSDIPRWTAEQIADVDLRADGLFHRLNCKPTDSGAGRDGKRWRMFRKFFDTPAKREQFRMFLGLEPGIFDPSIESMIDTAIAGAAGE